jgi:hopene-associated glycosyltransferase HpnB
MALYALRMGFCAPGQRESVILIALAIAVASLVVWTILLAGRGGFWLCREKFGAGDLAAAERSWPEVAVIIPARNEADVIDRSIGSVVRQDYPSRLRIVLVDDQSSDGTAFVAKRAAGLGRIDAPYERTVEVVAGQTVPRGWTGKLWALSQGLALADRAAPEFLLFLDADIALAPEVLRGLVAVARARGAVLTSLMVLLRCSNRAERWLVPAFVFFFQMLYPFGWVNDPRRKIAAAAGGCMLVHRQALEESGGVEALRGAIIDDCALAAQMKRRGPIWLGLTRDAVSLRAYDFKDFSRMVARSAFAELRYSTPRLLGAVLGMGLVFLAPPLLVFFGGGWARAAGAAAWLMMALAFAPTLRFYGRPVWSGLALSAIAAAYVLFTLQSAAQYWRGRGGIWKDRIQAPLPKVERA